jgi:hypothetical protein
MDDLEIVDILAQRRRKGVNSGRKGKRFELALVKVQNARFGGGFSRSIGSGNRYGQVANLPEHAQQIFFAVIWYARPILSLSWRARGGYDDIDLCSALAEGNAELDEFLQQVTEESKRTVRKPSLAWKKTRKPWLAFLRQEDMPLHDQPYRFYYREWVAVALQQILKLDNDFFYRASPDQSY